jgi:hypothetical protein
MGFNAELLRDCSKMGSRALLSASQTVFTLVSPNEKSDDSDGVRVKDKEVAESFTAGYLNRVTSVGSNADTKRLSSSVFFALMISPTSRGTLSRNNFGL